MKAPSVVPLGLLVLILGACGSGEDEAEELAASTDSVPSAEATSQTLREADSLSEFFGRPDDPEAMQAEFHERETRVQENVRRCMAEQGFQYRPILPPEEPLAVMGSDDDEERVRTRGFGITTWYGNDDRRSIEIVRDPNQKILEEMPNSERQAWRTALYGTSEEQQASKDFEAEVDEETGEVVHMEKGFGAGCQGEARDAEYGLPDSIQVLWDDIQSAMGDVRQRVEADPRVVELKEQWASCMAEAGYDGFRGRHHMWRIVHRDFQQRLDELTGSLGGFSDPFDGWSQEEIDSFFQEGTQEEVDAFFRQAQEEAEVNVDMEAVEALQQEEIDLAMADFECARGWHDEYSEVSREYEAAFIAKNRESLEQIREAEGR